MEINESKDGIAALLNPPESPDSGSIHYRQSIRTSEQGKWVHATLMVKSCAAQASLNLNCCGPQQQSAQSRLDKLDTMIAVLTKAREKLARAIAEVEP